MFLNVLRQNAQLFLRQGCTWSHTFDHTDPLVGIKAVERRQAVATGTVGRHHVRRVAPDLLLIVNQLFLRQSNLQ